MPPDFKAPKKPQGQSWYDIEFDKTLIEQSIAKQYGVLPTQQEHLAYEDWAKLVSGLMQDTPLGQVVAIRSEDDPEVIRGFTPGQQEIRREWREYLNRHTTPEDEEKQNAGLEALLARVFGGGET